MDQVRYHNCDGGAIGDGFQIRTLPNFVVHEYLGVDLGFVWEIVQDDLPLLRDQATSLIAMLNCD